MDFNLFRGIVKTRIFRVLLLLGIVYFLGYVVFKIWIEPDITKIPGQPGMWFRDFLWIIYWRWYLDWPIIAGFILIGSFLCGIFNRLSRLVKQDTLATYFLPLILTIVNFIGMLAIDIAITWFADVNINGTWDSTEILLFGLTAQKLYHGFFFWFIPALFIVGVPVNTYIHRKRSIHFYKQLFVLMAGFSLTLGFLDPVVCQVIWDNWRIFGEWNMMGLDAMWAEGWIAHYCIFAALWLCAAWIIQHLYAEILVEKNMISKSNLSNVLVPRI